MIDGVSWIGVLENWRGAWAPSVDEIQISRARRRHGDEVRSILRVEDEDKICETMLRNVMMNRGVVRSR